ncbi:hypothetical protein Ddye_004469 [Dipteronia dyeriana]|uniref:Reverse transcriptase n=1 Tax=Dipteronia dyeriana TaxID=168575 RepID=A0AAD9XUR1_9ROSI|nr:hypothetical protein Ddye_004469 [Dipteronia dyeriana]
MVVLRVHGMHVGGWLIFSKDADYDWRRRRTPVDFYRGAIRKEWDVKREKRGVLGAKLRWIDVYGVPLNYCCKAFFKKLKGQSGETVLVDENTILKRSLDRWKMLVLAPFDNQGSGKVKVKIGHNSFMVRWSAIKDKDIRNTKSLEERLARIDGNAARDGWSDLLRQERLKMLVEYWKVIYEEEQEWRQKSRIKWLIEGDRNSRFYHSVASGRRRNNLIDDIAFDRVNISNPEEIMKGVADFFDAQYKNVQWLCQCIKDLPLKKCLAADRDFLKENFILEEVRNALSNCDGNKAPGLDSFNLNFIKNNWDVRKSDFMAFIKDFHRDSSVVKGINRIFIAFIPKCIKPHVRGDGFREELCQWMGYCVSSSNLSVLVNGSLTRQFGIERGLQ